MDRIGRWCGLAGGPLLVVVLAGQALWNPRYDVGADPISSLARGPHGWVQITTFVVVGLLVAAFGTFVRRRGPGSLARLAGTLLVVMGGGLVGVGAFVTHPTAWYGVVHNLATGVAINAGLLAVAVLAVARWGEGRRWAAGYGLATVVACAVLGWSTDEATIVARHTVVVVLLAAWLTATALLVPREAGPAPGR